MNETLMGIVVDVLAFLELSDDDVIDPDSAVNQMESIAAALQRLGPSGLQEFLRYVHKRTAKTRDRETKSFLRGLPEALGLTEG